LQPIGNVQDGSVATLSSREYKGLSCGRDGMTSAAVIAFGAQNSAAQGDSVSTDVTPTLDKSKTPAVAIGSHWDGDDNAHPALAQSCNKSGGIGYSNQEIFSQRGAGLVQASAVRRLTPVECERLQGFPDDYTRIAWRNMPAESCPDGPRYKAMGNSMAVPVMRWIGERIQMVDAL